MKLNLTDHEAFQRKLSTIASETMRIARVRDVQKQYEKYPQSALGKNEEIKFLHAIITAAEYCDMKRKDEFFKLIFNFFHTHIQDDINQTEDELKSMLK